MCGGLLWSACVVLLAGCITPAQIRDDVRRSREAAIEEWQRARAGEECSRPTIKGQLTLAAAQLLATGNNKQLKAILQEKEVASGRITEAYAEALPKVDLSGSYTRLDKVSSFSAGPETVTMGAKDNYSLALTLSQPIFRGGAIGAGIRAAKVYSLLADEQVRGVVQAVLFQTRQGYYDILLARELVKVSEADLGRVRRHLADLEKRRDQGVATEYDVLRARVEVSNVEAQLIERQNAFRLANTSLLKTLGVSQGSEVQLAGKLEHQATAAKLAEAVAAAFRQRPDLIQAELGVRLQREALQAAKAGWWPRADLFLTETYAKPDPSSMTNIEWASAWNAGATVTWPIFDGLRTAGMVRQERARLKGQEIGLLDAEEKALLEVRQALLSIEDAEKFVKSQSANLERAREGLRLAGVGYREGVTTEIEVLDARQALSTTQALYYRAVYSHMKATLLLERATGALKPPGEGAAE